jgi:hypothetical protein
MQHEGQNLQSLHAHHFFSSPQPISPGRLQAMDVATRGGEQRHNRPERGGSTAVFPSTEHLRTFLFLSYWPYVVARSPQPVLALPGLDQPIIILTCLLFALDMTAQPNHAANLVVTALPTYRHRCGACHGPALSDLTPEPHFAKTLPGEVASSSYSTWSSLRSRK